MKKLAICDIERKSLPTDGQLDLSFYRSMWQSLVTRAPQGDTIVAKTDPPLTSIVAMAAARRNGAQLVNWIRYIYLETAVDWECHSCAAHSPRSLMA